VPTATPAPAAPTPLRLGAADAYQSGDLTLQPGAALIGSRNGKSFQLDGDAVDALMPSGLYIPSVAAISDLAVWANLRSSGAVRLRQLELNLTAAAAAADVTNYFGVRVRDTSGNSVTVGMTGTGRRFSTDLYGVDVKGSLAINGSGGLGQAYGYWQRFRPSSDMTVSALFFASNNAESLKDGRGAAKVYEVLDSTGATVLASSLPTTAQISNGGVSQTFGQAVSFQQAYTLKQNTDYWIGCRLLDATNAWQPNARFEGGATVGGTSNQGANGKMITVAGQTFAQAVDSGSGGTFAMPFGLVGTVGGLRLVGDVHVDIVSAGTGGTPTTGGVNLRANWTQSA
jgi:hypothetical protein